MFQFGRGPPPRHVRPRRPPSAVTVRVVSHLVLTGRRARSLLRSAQDGFLSAALHPPCTAEPLEKMRFFSLRDAVEVKMPTKDNGCLLYSLTYDGAPKGRGEGDAAAMKALRKKVADFALQNRAKVFNGMLLEEWVEKTNGVDVKTWAAKFVDTEMMSDQIVLFIWPHIMGEAVCVWRRCLDGYEHGDIYTFSSPDISHGLRCRHVVYLPDELHYNALQVVRPGAVLEGAVPKPAVVRRHLLLGTVHHFPKPFTHVGRWICLVVSSATAASRAPRHMLRKQVHLRCSTTTLIRGT